MRTPDSTLTISSRRLTETRRLRRRSRFIKRELPGNLPWLAPRRLAYKGQSAPQSRTRNANRWRDPESRLPTARLLHGAVRAARSTSAAPGPAQSTMIASNRSRVRSRNATSALVQCSTAISRSPSVRRSTRPILSSEQSNSDFKFIPGLKPFQLADTRAVILRWRTASSN